MRIDGDKLPKSVLSKFTSYFRLGEYGDYVPKDSKYKVHFFEVFRPDDL